MLYIHDKASKNITFKDQYFFPKMPTDIWILCYVPPNISIENSDFGGDFLILLSIILFMVYFISLSEKEKSYHSRFHNK